MEEKSVLNRRLNFVLDDFTVNENQNSFKVRLGATWLNLKMPTIFFVHKEGNAYKLLFGSSTMFRNFILSLAFVIRRLTMVYFLRLKLRGLGYRFKKISSTLYRFYFTRTNYIYFHCPKNILIKSRRKRIILLSCNKQILNLVFSNIVDLHKVGPYNRRGFTYPRRIIFMKKGKKII